MSAHGKKAHVVVVGAGVIGVTTAYYLSQAGYKVTVVDRAPEVAAGASHSNAGQLSYSFTDSLAKPEFVAKIPALIAGRDIGSHMRLAPRLIHWGFHFLLQCTNQRAKQNTIAVLQSAMRSAQLLDEMRTSLPFDFAHRSAGKLVLLSDVEQLQAASRNSRLKNEYGCDTEILSASEAIQLEPALADLSESFAGAVFSKSDEVADARKFTLSLRDWLEANADVNFQMNTDINHLVRHKNRVSAVSAADREIEADAAVVCTGAWSSDLLRPLGINPRVYPVRGYSVTLPTTEQSPNVSVTAQKQRIVFSRINGLIRIAGFADFKDFSTKDDADRIDSLIDVAREFAPDAADYDSNERYQWGGFRPMTPDGRPRIGATNIDGLFLNTGHGMLGWTLACASGYDIAQSIGKTIH